MRLLTPRVGVALVGATALAVGPLALPAHAADVTIQILSINDFHGRLEQSGNVAGAAVLAGAVEQFEAANPNSVYAAAGDIIGASTFVSFIQDDNPTIDAMNASHLQVSAVGNHEFDQGYNDLTDDVIGGSDGHPAAWPYLGANVYFKGTQDPALQEYALFKLADVTVGFVGVVTDETPSLVSPDGVAMLDFGRPVDAINRVAAQLTDGDDSNGEADVVVALAHEGAPEATEESATGDNPFGDIVNNAIPAVKAIISGHTHLVYNFELPVPGEPGTTRPVISSGSYGTNLGQITLNYDPSTGEVTDSTVVNNPLMNDDDGDGEYEPNYPADPKVQKIVDKAVAEAQELGDQPLGKVTANITRAFDVVDGALEEDRGEESTLGNLVADVQLEAAADPVKGGAQIAFMNPGGLRADICYAEAEYEGGVPACPGVKDDGGVITYREAATVQPFANTLVTEKLTGAQIREVLEQQSQPAGSTRPYLQLGVSNGFRYTYTVGEADPGTGVIPLDIKDMWLNGVPIDAAATYSVVVNSFLAAGGDNFTTFADGTDKADTGQIDLQSFVDYMGEHSPVSPDTQERAIDLATQAQVDITWPDAIGNPPAMRAGTSQPFALATTLPVALPDELSLTADVSDGISVDFDNGGETDGTYQTLIEGLPAGPSSLPFAVSVDKSVAKGTYDLVFTLDRTGDSSIFDGNPIATPNTFTVSLEVSAVGHNPGGGIGTGLTGGGEDRSPVGAIAGGSALVALTILGTLALRRRRGSVI